MTKYIISIGRRFGGIRIHEIIKETPNTYRAKEESWKNPGTFDATGGRISVVSKGLVVAVVETAEEGFARMKAAKAVENRHKPLIDELETKMQEARKKREAEVLAALKGEPA